VSNQDDHFMNVFSVVLGSMIVIAIGIFVFSRILGGAEQARQRLVDPMHQGNVAERVAPIGRVAIAGQDNSALKVAPPPGAAPAAALALPANGEETYKVVCGACHGQGIGGAPKVGDKAAWAPRIAQGKDLLYKHAVEGFQGKAGLMPAKGGRIDLTDDLVRQAVDHMVALEQ
jgi:cytochrome c5